MCENYVYYQELVQDSIWGEDKVLIKDDINLLENSNFNIKGYEIFPMEDHNILLNHLIKKRIADVISKDIDIINYHDLISEEEHKNILNSMPYKKNDDPEITRFCEYLEEFVSDKLNTKLKIFNDDIWVRICRPSSISNKDYNPCHRDTYLDFYRNTVNVYIPIVGSDENSSLLIQEGSHYWNENMTAVTTGGAHFKSNDKKYSVDAIVQSKIKLNMVRPNPSINEILIFSPYLIHGCSDNNNENTTRISLEIRFIKKNREGSKQEEDIKEFIKKRVWR